MTQFPRRKTPVIVGHVTKTPLSHWLAAVTSQVRFPKIGRSSALRLENITLNVSFRQVLISTLLYITLARFIGIVKLSLGRMVRDRECVRALSTFCEMSSLPLYILLGE